MTSLYKMLRTNDLLTNNLKNNFKKSRTVARKTTHTIEIPQHKKLLDMLNFDRIDEDKDSIADLDEVSE